MTTYYLRNRARGFRLPFPFRSEQAAECHRLRIDDDNEYAVFAVVEADCGYSQREADDTYFEAVEDHRWNVEQDIQREELRR